MTDASATESDADRGPQGQVLEGARRLTYRQARPWLKRGDVLVGTRPCGMTIRWLSDADRQVVVERLRHAEGKDCSVAGDVLLYRLPEANIVVVEEPY